MDFILRDVAETHSGVAVGSVAVEKDMLGLLIKIRGYGDHDSQDGEGSPIFLEVHEGKLRLLVWDDINQEEPRIIPLHRALESNRIVVAIPKTTAGQVDKYVAGNGVSCLHCGSGDLNCGDWDTSDTMVCRQVTCGDCNRTWTDEFKLIGVTTDET